MKIFFIAFCCMAITPWSMSQLLGIYEFTGTGTCPNQAPNVTAQPADASFAPFSHTGLNCVSTANVYNTDGWNTTVNIDLNEYLEFAVQATDCYRVNLDSIIFEYRNTASGNTPAWHLRSSVDNYANDIASGISMTTPGMLVDTIVLSTDFYNLREVTFRIYLTEMGSIAAAFRVDNLQVYGFVSNVGPISFYPDTDGDGYGSGAPESFCANPGGYASNADDCDDNDPQLNPATVWYQDNDGDGFGDDNTTQTGCTSTLVNPVLIGGDCSDMASDLHPNTVWYEDADGDFYGNTGSFEVGCTHTFAQAVLNDDDCNDGEPTIYPGAPEICDEFDNDCDGSTNEGLTTTVYYIDNDGDGYGQGSAGDFCNDPGIGYVLNDDDCDDDNSAVNPMATEVPLNSIDENCDGMDYFPFDEDNDGFFSNQDDCNDTDAGINPGAIDSFGDGIDQNCDGTDGNLGISDLSLAKLALFPNPGTDIVRITFTGENGILSLTDSQGKVVFTQMLSANGEIEIHTAGLAKGSYQFLLLQDSGVSRASWVKL